MSERITERERIVYEQIKKSIQDGVVPSVRELCSSTGIKSTSTVHRTIKSLVDKGYLEQSGNKLNRAIKLAGSGGTKVPLLGTVTAGMPITAIEQIEDFIDFTPRKNYDGELFALKVRGDSMINIAITDGDIVVAERTPIVSNGEVAVILVDGDSATVKRFYKENGHFRLQPENDDYDPIITDDAAILGRVIAVVRYLE